MFLADFPQASGDFRVLDAGSFRIGHPAGWQVYQSGSAVTLAPQGGLVQSGQATGLAYGAMISLYEPQSDDLGRVSLNQATSELIEDLRHSNPGLRVIGRQRLELDGRAARSATMRGMSPVRGEPEIDWLVTTMRPDGRLLYIVFVAPERDFTSYRPVFVRMLESVQLAR